MIVQVVPVKFNSGYQDCCNTKDGENIRYYYIQQIMYCDMASNYDITYEITNVYKFKR